MLTHKFINVGWGIESTQSNRAGPGAEEVGEAEVGANLFSKVELTTNKNSN